MPPIQVPAPQQTEDSAIEYLTEVAFGAMIAAGRNSGLRLEPVMGLMYLPDEAVTAQFQAACRAVLASLASKP